MDLVIPESYTTLQVVAVQNLKGRQHAHVRVFGYRTGDANRVIVEVAVDPDEAVDLIAAADREKKFPEIEVPSRYIIYIITTGGIDMIHIGEVGEDPNGPGPHPPA